MIIFPPQQFITWTNALTQFPWPIQLNDFPPTPKSWAGSLLRGQTNLLYSLTMIMSSRLSVAVKQEMCINFFVHGGE